LINEATSKNGFSCGDFKNRTHASASPSRSSREIYSNPIDSAVIGFGQCVFPPNAVRYPPARNTCPNAFDNAASGTTAGPLDRIPKWLGYRPVIIDVRAGIHTGFPEYANSNRVPDAASRSMCGVCNHRFPVQLIIPACCWSVMMYTIFGRAGAAAATAADLKNPRRLIPIPHSFPNPTC
jgi:hypothetical protein